ncbi:class II fructose-bisphosphate aldolase [Cryobacterium levicorallinum]|uniref:Class II fructose-bisphosphate aldolase n=1 Tax=Cryobacterium levicorallinum TaxID=995038 RepID=A0A1I2Y598_9MICO|nr:MULTISPECIES: class II fructose-bisphosphate aldolase [Cryobacterium]TFB85167.1 class II fructose-bisphosphate aldolase [Cryobacterium levicorallinum]SFH20835.1 fructose-bisphosphate aldolase, class II [Cryobacterium levicorallinum]
MGKFDPAEIVESARRGGYAVGGFNMHNVETTQALLQAAELADAPVFMQVGRAVVPHMGLAESFRMTQRELSKSDAQAVIHLDHGTYDEVFEALRLGFDSIMFDGSHLDFEDNIKATKYVVKVCHSFGVPVEAELGKIPDANTAINWPDFYTSVDEAERFVAETGVDFLAISAGVMHGVTATEPLPLDIERIARIRDVTGIPLVLHGASGVPLDDIRAAIAAGINKLNADTDLRHAFRRGIEETWALGDRQLEDGMAEGRRQMIEATVQKMREFGCADRSQNQNLAQAVTA